MPTSIVIGAVVGFILLFLMVIFLLQMRERMRDERVREINSSADRLRLYQRLLEELPVSYISKAVRIRLLERIIEVVNELKSMDKNRDFSSAATKASAELETVRQKPEQEQSHAAIQDEAQALEVRKLLKLLYRFIEGERNDGRMDVKTASQNMMQTSFLIARSLADLYVTKAQAAVAIGRYRVAIDQLHNAIDAMEKVQGSALAQQCILMYRKQIKELDQRASEELTPAPVVAAPVEDHENQENKLSSQWDRLMSEEDKWKKKQAYD